MSRSGFGVRCCTRLGMGSSLICALAMRTACSRLVVSHLATWSLAALMAPRATSEGCVGGRLVLGLPVGPAAEESGDAVGGALLEGLVALVVEQVFDGAVVDGALLLRGVDDAFALLGDVDGV